ncbi:MULTISPECIES: DUF2505 domain-containing protein [unclassified Gordonia (in: high G+C Gram-positive bacteria)]|uniref:DUF2505 domain-containing protein n=1 Tax=Gordonia sp. B7-2 TaxID=3420932 RepID=UPI003D8AAF2A
MSSKLQHSVSYPFSTQRLWEIVSTEQYWHDLVARINADHGRVDSFTLDGDTVVVEMHQGVPADKLPSSVTKIKPGDMEIPRRNTYRLVGDKVDGEISATVDGAPVKIRGTVVTTGDPARTDYTADVAVSIPLLGGKIEKSVIGQLIDLLDAEHGHTVDWEQENRLT